MAKIDRSWVGGIDYRHFLETTRRWCVVNFLVGMTLGAATWRTSIPPESHLDPNMAHLADAHTYPMLTLHIATQFSEWAFGAPSVSQGSERIVRRLTRAPSPMEFF